MIKSHIKLWPFNRADNTVKNIKIDNQVNQLIEYENSYNKIIEVLGLNKLESLLLSGEYKTKNEFLNDLHDNLINAQNYYSKSVYRFYLAFLQVAIEKTIKNW